MVRAFLWALITALLMLLISGEVLAPTGPTTIGREYAPLAISFFAGLVAFAMVVFEETIDLWSDRDEDDFD